MRAATGGASSPGAAIHRADGHSCAQYSQLLLLLLEHGHEPSCSDNTPLADASYCELVRRAIVLFGDRHVVPDLARALENVIECLVRKSNSVGQVAVSCLASEGETSAVPNQAKCRLLYIMCTRALSTCANAEMVRLLRSGFNKPYNALYARAFFAVSDSSDECHAAVSEGLRDELLAVDDESWEGASEAKTASLIAGIAAIACRASNPPAFWQTMSSSVLLKKPAGGDDEVEATPADELTLAWLSPEAFAALLVCMASSDRGVEVLLNPDGETGTCACGLLLEEMGRRCVEICELRAAPSAAVELLRSQLSAYVRALAVLCVSNRGVQDRLDTLCGTRAWTALLNTCLDQYQSGTPGELVVDVRDLLEAAARGHVSNQKRIGAIFTAMCRSADATPVWLLNTVHTVVFAPAKVASTCSPSSMLSREGRSCTGTILYHINDICVPPGRLGPRMASAQYR